MSIDDERVPDDRIALIITDPTRARDMVNHEGVLAMAQELRSRRDADNMAPPGGGMIDLESKEYLDLTVDETGKVWINDHERCLFRVGHVNYIQLEVAGMVPKKVIYTTPA